MSDYRKPPKSKGTRQARLEAALRENLKRRKAQARGREAERSPAPTDECGRKDTEADKGA